MMGCDIHITLERKRPLSNNWIGVYTTDICGPRRGKAAQRNYGFFAQLASVRGHAEYDKPHGSQNFFPENVSALALEQAAAYGSDGHSHGHTSLDEFLAIWMASVSDNESARHKHLAFDLFGLDLSDDYDTSDSKSQWRVVFFFDN